MKVCSDECDECDLIQSQDLETLEVRNFFVYMVSWLVNDY